MNNLFRIPENSVMICGRQRSGKTTLMYASIHTQLSHAPKADILLVGSDTLLHDMFESLERSGSNVDNISSIDTTESLDLVKHGFALQFTSIYFLDEVIRINSNHVSFYSVENPNIGTILYDLCKNEKKVHTPFVYFHAHHSEYEVLPFNQHLENVDLLRKARRGNSE